MLAHVSIQCADFAASTRFYDAVLAPLGGVHVMDFGQNVAYGVGARPSFVIGQQTTGGQNREVHIAFDAANRAAVEPRLWPEYHANYYGAFVRDPDGNNVEAVCHTPE